MPLRRYQTPSLVRQTSSASILPPLVKLLLVCRPAWCRFRVRWSRLDRLLRVSETLHCLAKRQPLERVTAMAKVKVKRPAIVMAAIATGTGSETGARV